MKKREKKRLIVVLVLTALIFVFMGVSYSLTSAGRANPLSSAAQFIFSPVQSVFSKAGRSVGGFFEALSNVYTYREENERLKTEIDVLKQETRSIESLKQENERLRELLNFKETSTEYDMVGCEVIAKDAGNWFGTFKVDKGTSSGIQKDDVAVLRRALDQLKAGFRDGDRGGRQLGGNYFHYRAGKLCGRLSDKNAGHCHCRRGFGPKGQRQAKAFVHCRQRRAGCRRLHRNLRHWGRLSERVIDWNRQRNFNGQRQKHQLCGCRYRSGF